MTKQERLKEIYEQKLSELRAENTRLRTELARIKPSWDDAPDDVNWMAIDEAGGRWGWHRSKPEPVENLGGWGEWQSGSWEPARVTNWKDTLEERPKGQRKDHNGHL